MEGDPIEPQSVEPQAVEPDPNGDTWPPTVGAWTILAPTADLDLASAPQLRSRIVELVSSGRTRIIVDLARVEFIDSTGLGVLVGGLKRARVHDGDLRLAAPVARVRRVLQITDLDRVFEPFPTVADAIAAGS